MSRAPSPTSPRRARLVQVLPYLPRVGRWAAVPAGATVAALLVVLGTAGDSPDVDAATVELRIAAVLLAATAAFSLDDPAADTLAPSPSTLRWRRGASLALMLAVVAGCWHGLLALTAVLLDGGGRGCLAVVRGGLTVELAALVAVAVAIAAIAARRLGGTVGGVAAAVAVILAFIAMASPPLDALPASPTDLRWSAGHRRLLLGAVALAAVAGWAVRDAWRSRRGGRLRRTGAGVLVLSVLGVLVLSVLGVPASPLLQSHQDDDLRLDTVLSEVVAAQGIEGLVAVVDGPDVTWARTVDGDRRVAPLAAGRRDQRMELGTMHLAEVGTTMDVAGGPLQGQSSPAELVPWARALADGAGEPPRAAPAVRDAARWRRVAAGRSACAGSRTHRADRGARRAGDGRGGRRAHGRRTAPALRAVGRGRPRCRAVQLTAQPDCSEMHTHSGARHARIIARREPMSSERATDGGSHSQIGTVPPHTEHHTHTRRPFTMRTTILTAATAVTLLGSTAPALAHHEHQLVNPGTTVVFQCEPEAASDVHPIHNGLHMSFKHNVPATAPVTVGPTGGTCLY